MEELEDEEMIISEINMEELQKQLEEAQQKIRDLEAQIIKLNNDLGKYKVIYNCDKTDYYKFKIKMYENESLYIDINYELLIVQNILTLKLPNSHESL